MTADDQTCNKKMYKFSWEVETIESILLTTTKYKGFYVA